MGIRSLFFLFYKHRLWMLVNPPTPSPPPSPPPPLPPNEAFLKSTNNLCICLDYYKFSSKNAFHRVMNRVILMIWRGCCNQKGEFPVSLLVAEALIKLCKFSVMFSNLYTTFVNFCMVFYSPKPFGQWV